MSPPAHPGSSARPLCLHTMKPSKELPWPTRYLHLSNNCPRQWPTRWPAPPQRGRSAHRAVAFQWIRLARRPDRHMRRSPSRRRGSDGRLPGGTSTSAELVGRDAGTDIALLRVEGASPPPDRVRCGAGARGRHRARGGFARGTPVAAAGVVSLSAPGWRSLRGGEIDARIELGLTMRRLSEGGLALDAQGRTIGMSVFGPRRRVLVIPGATIDRVAGKWLRTGGCRAAISGWACSR